jgi:UDP-N-acetylglucosamine 4-epimerase
MTEFQEKLENKRILVTGGAGFIGSNLCETLIGLNAKVVCLDNFATGHKHNLEVIKNQENFKLIEGDIRNLETCHKACENVDYVLHEAALGSVPRSLADPITSNEVNISGFLNMLVAARDAGVKRFIYAASSSTYGDSEKLPKLYADIFQGAYKLDTIGLRYFNVFGRKQDPNGAYAAVIPKFVMQFMKHISPVINGDGTYSRDFTYIDNVVQMNLRAITSENEKAVNEVYNTAVGDRTNLVELTQLLKKHLSEFDPKIANVEIKHGPNRAGDIPHSLASVEKAKELLGYNPSHRIDDGLREAVAWYWDNLNP